MSDEVRIMGAFFWALGLFTALIYSVIALAFLVSMLPMLGPAARGSVFTAVLISGALALARAYRYKW